MKKAALLLFLSILWYANIQAQDMTQKLYLDLHSMRWVAVSTNDGYATKAIQNRYSKTSTWSFEKDGQLTISQNSGISSNLIYKLVTLTNAIDIATTGVLIQTVDGQKANYTVSFKQQSAQVVLMYLHNTTTNEILVFYGRSKV